MSLQEIKWPHVTSFCFKVAVASALIWGFSSYQSSKLPKFFAASPQLQKEPVQTPTAKTPFHLTVRDQDYQLQPVADYEISGLVVADHDPSSWMGRVHEVWKDFINTKDLCVVWGANAVSPYLKDLNFSHGEWTCYVQTNSSEAWQAFRKDQLSNNHVIPADSSIAELIRKSEVGDEISFKGQLVNYSINGGGSRNTSLDRNDVENGACEIVYVESFQTIARHNLMWVNLRKIGKGVFLFAAFGILISIGMISLRKDTSLL